MLLSPRHRDGRTRVFGSHRHRGPRSRPSAGKLIAGGVPMARVALISDIHSNEVALRAVVADIRRTGVDQIICLGDVANLGPAPNAVIEILAGLECPCIMGNHDEFLLDPSLVRAYNDAPRIIASV